jgi:hypothetical protein
MAMGRCNLDKISFCYKKRLDQELEMWLFPSRR